MKGGNRCRSLPAAYGAAPGAELEHPEGPLIWANYAIQWLMDYQSLSGDLLNLEDGQILRVACSARRNKPSDPITPTASLNYVGGRI